MKNDLISPESDVNQPHIMSGYELARYVLDHSSEGVEVLIELSNNDESDWLELKAGMELLPEDVKKGDKPDDLYWNIASAVLEIMNTSGGALIIGIENKSHKVIPLRENDSLHIIEQRGMEAYRRQAILERIWPSGVKKWSQPKEKKTWQIKDVVPENLLEIRGAHYQGEDIAVILIKPALPAVRIWKNDEVEQIRARVPGDIGKVLEIKGGKQMDLYDQNRCVETESYAALHQRFLERVKSQSDDACLNEKIENYYRDFEKKISEQKVFSLSWFTSLDASGEIVEGDEQEDDFMEPQAIEWFENEDWREEREDEIDEEEYANDDGGVIDNKKIEDGNEKNTHYREKRFGDILQLMHNKDLSRILLLGEPGGGKTTSFIRFVTQFHQPNKSKQILAVFIPMGKWRKGDSLSLMLKNITGLVPLEWLKLIETNRLRLVIDAVNECPDSFRKAAVESIQSFLREYPDLPVAISARSDEDLKYLHLPTFTVQPMDAAHQLNYLTSYLKDIGQAQALLTRLQEMPSGMEIAANPLLLYMVVDYYISEGELPVGRAVLYRRSIKKWYAREYGKAKTAGDRLPWTFEKIIEILSDLSFHSRLQGYRDVPIEVASSILEKYGEECITKLCQGPVVTVDEDFIRFRHETFQEYFCAEYLIKHSDALPQLTRKDSAQWGMPLAYSAELQWPLPDQLWRSAWKIDPWFGFAVTDDDRIGQAKEMELGMEHPFLSQVISNCELKRMVYGFYVPLKVICKNNGLWFSNKDQKLGYVILTNEMIRKRWLRIELGMIKKSKIKDECTVLSQTIVLKQYAGHSIHQTIKNIMDLVEIPVSPSLEKRLQTFEKWVLTDESVENAMLLVQEGFASKNDFNNRLLHWISNASISDAEKLTASGLAKREDFSERLPLWIHNASIPDAEKLIASGLANREDFSERLPLWIHNASISDAEKLISSGLAKREDFSETLPLWVHNASIFDAEKLIASGLAKREDFSESLPLWIHNANIFEVEKLIASGLAKREDFSEQIGDIISQIKTKNDFTALIRTGLATKDVFMDIFTKTDNLDTPKIAVWLINNGFAKAEDFNQHINKWKESSNIKDIVYLYKKNLISTEDFWAIVEKKKFRSITKAAICLIKNRYATKKDLKDRIDNWILNASPKKAMCLVQNGLATKEDFKDKIDNWILKSDIQNVYSLIKGNWISKSEIEDKIKQWIDDADPKKAHLLIQYKFATKGDFKERIERWKSNLDPSLAYQLLKYNFITLDDCKPQIDQWKMNADLKDLLVQYNLVPKEDY